MAKRMKNILIQKVSAVIASRRRSDERTLSLSEIELDDRMSVLSNKGGNVSDVDSSVLPEVTSELDVGKGIESINGQNSPTNKTSSKIVPFQEKDTVFEKKLKVKGKRKVCKERNKKSKRNGDNVKVNTEHGVTQDDSKQASDNISLAIETLATNRLMENETNCAKESIQDGINGDELTTTKSKTSNVKPKIILLKSSKDIHTVNVKRNEMCPESAGNDIKKKEKKKRKKRSNKDRGIGENNTKKPSEDCVSDKVFKATNTKRVSIGETIPLPNENKNSRIFSWLASSKFSDTSDNELNPNSKSRKHGKKHRRRKTIRDVDSTSTHTATEVPEIIIPAFNECNDEACVKYKCIQEIEITDPKQILVLDFDNEKPPDSDQTDAGVKDEIKMSEEEVCLAPLEAVSETKDTVLPGGSEGAVCDDHTDDPPAYEGNGQQVKPTNAQKQQQQHTSGDSQSETLVNCNQASYAGKKDKQNEAWLKQAVTKQRHTTEALFRRMELFTGIVLEEELKLPKYSRMNKRRAEAEFDRVMDRIIQYLLGIHDEFQARLDVVHRANMEVVDKEIHTCRMIRSETMSVMDQIHDQRGVDNDSTEQKFKEKADVYKEILWRSYKECRRFDYEIELDQRIMSLLCESDMQDFCMLGRIDGHEQRIRRPIAIIEHSNDAEDHVTLEHKQTYAIRHYLDECVPDITGCVCLDDGYILIADKGNCCIKLVNVESLTITRHVFDGGPWDVCVLDTDEIAVSVPGEMRVYLVRLSGPERDIEVVSHFDAGSRCFGLVCVHGNIIVTCHSEDGTSSMKGFTKDGLLMAFFQNDQHGRQLFTCPQYVSASLDSTQLFVSDTGSNTVLGITLTGCITFRYSHTKLNRPSAITVFKNDSFVVCSAGSRNVQLVSNSGEFIRTLVESDEDVQIICKNTRADTLMLSFPNGNIMLYEFLGRKFDNLDKNEK